MANIGEAYGGFQIQKRNDCRECCGAYFLKKEKILTVNGKQFTKRTVQKAKDHIELGITRQEFNALKAQSSKQLKEAPLAYQLGGKLPS